MTKNKYKKGNILTFGEFLNKKNGDIIHLDYSNEEGLTEECGFFEVERDEEDKTRFFFHQKGIMITHLDVETYYKMTDLVDNAYNGGWTYTIRESIKK